MSVATDNLGSSQSAKTSLGSTIVRRDAVVSEELKNSDLHPLLKKVYANRGVTKLKQVDYSLKDLFDFSLLKFYNCIPHITCSRINTQYIHNYPV